jgi:prolyl-tRNA synthetase
MRDGNALQMGTSHELGQNFAHAFGIRFSDRDGQLRHAWQTSWGASTRLLGAMIMVHGDDQGLRVPPRLAPSQVILLRRAPERAESRRRRRSSRISRGHGVRVELDDRLEISLGRRMVVHELRGVPLRIDLGPSQGAGGRPRSNSSASSTYPTKGGFMESVLLDAAGHPRSPATRPGYHRGRAPRKQGRAVSR